MVVKVSEEYDGDCHYIEHRVNTGWYVLTLDVYSDYGDGTCTTTMGMRDSFGQPLCAVLVSNHGIELHGTDHEILGYDLFGVVYG